jgi:hypothetical protein
MTVSTTDTPVLHSTEVAHLYLQVMLPIYRGCIMGFIINCDLFFNWDDIYLYLVTTNKILRNLLKAMLRFNHFL